MSEDMRIGILGGGPWGLSLARAARRAGSLTTLYSRRRRDGEVAAVRVTSDLAVLAESHLIIVAVPSQLARSVARSLGDHLTGAHLLVHGIRGLSGDELATISQILREETPARRLGALGGPVQAAELNDGRPSAMVVGSDFEDVSRAVHRAMNSEWLHIHRTSDLIGLEWASSLMGCLSIGVGYVMAREDVSPGLLAALISGSVDEAAVIAQAAGAHPDTFYGLGGYGDLLASMALPDRPEVVLGRELASGKTIDEAQTAAKLRIEAIDLIPRVVRFAHSRGVPCPMFSGLAAVLSGDASPEALLRGFFGSG
ncbi:MAG: NAD(P)-binding domain-containing protein [Myxococcales bacterium]|nr:NAD(P)-binding domain-containing protein [Myxococcales bacterium]